MMTRQQRQAQRQERTAETNRLLRRTRLIWQIWATVTVVLLAVGLISTFSAAFFGDSEPVGGNTFTAGTVIIDGTPTTAAFNLPALYPGDQAVMELTATNIGTEEFRYAVTSTTTEDTLASELVLTVRNGVTTCDLTDWDATGAQLYQGKLGDTTTPGGFPLFGDATTGADAGDRVLAASSAEDLCFHVVLPVAAQNQNTSTTATFNFIAEQTKNN